MPPKALTKAQKTQVSSLRDVLDCDEAYAVRLLQTVGWRMEEAVEHHYLNPPPVPAAAATGVLDGAKIAREFARLAGGADKAKIEVDQFVAFFEELGLDPSSDPLALYVCYQGFSKTMGEFSKEEFDRLCRRTGVETTAALKAKLPVMRTQMGSSDRFPPFFVWCYEFSCEPGQKSITLETAIGLLPLLITEQRWPLVASFVAYLETQKKTVSKDTWMLLLEFAATVKPDMSNYDEDAAWPVMFDEFYEYSRKQGGAARGAGKA